MEEIKQEINPISIEGIEKILFQMKNCICRIHKENGTKGIGFFCKIPFPDISTIITVLITSYHSLNENDIENDKIIEFYINDDKEKKIIKIDNTRKKFNNSKLDLTFIEIKPEEDKINNFLELDEDIYIDRKIIENIYKRKSVYIIHYPNEKSLHVSYSILNNMMDNDIFYYFNTDDDLSGSPIFSLDSFKIIGIHNDSSKNNNFSKGTFIKCIIDEIQKDNKTENKNDNNNINLNNKIDDKKIIYNEISLIYKVKEKNNKIKLFGHEFVNNNKDNCIIIIDKEELKLCQYYKQEENKFKKKEFKIKLKETKTITNMSHMFGNCESLLSLPDFSEWNTENVTDMNNLFYNCISLISLPDISKWNVSNVTDMSYMFYNCISLKALPDISLWDTGNVVDMSNMFGNCILLQYLPDISKWNTINVTDMSCMFCNCEILTYLPDISKWKTFNVLDMSYMFNNCKKLINIPYKFIK